MANQPISYRWNPYDRANHVVIEAPPPPPPSAHALPLWQLPTPPIVPVYEEPPVTRRWSTFESIPLVVQPYHSENDDLRRMSFIDLRSSHGSSTVAAPSRASFYDHSAICRDPSNSSFAGLSSQPSAVSTSLATTVSSHSETRAPAWRPSPTPVAPHFSERFEPSHATFAPRPSPAFVPMPPAPIAPAVLSSLKRYPFFCDVASRQHYAQPATQPPLKPERPMGTPPSSSSGSSRHSSTSAPRRYVFESALAPQQARGSGPQPCAPQRAARVSPTPEESSSTTSLDAPRFKSTGYARRQRRLKLKAAMAQRRLASETASSTEPADP